MPSNEALELLESVLSESENSRLKYLKRQHDKAEDAGNRMNQSSKDINRISDDIDNLKPGFRNIKKKKELNKELDQAFENNEKASEDWNDAAGKINKYSTGTDDSHTIGSFSRTKSDIKDAGKNLRDEMERGKKYHSYGYQTKLGDYANKVAKSYAGKQAYMNDFGGPVPGNNTIGSHILYYGNGSNDPKYSNYGKDSVLDVEFKKEQLKKRVEDAKKNPRKVVGGYKLEAAQILIEALDTLLSE